MPSTPPMPPHAERDESPSATLRVAPHVRATLRDDAGTLIDLRRGTYLALNPLGARIWPWLDAGLPHDAILDRLAASFSAPREILTKDLDAFVATLIGQGLLVHSDNAHRIAAQPTNERPSTRAHRTQRAKLRRPPSTLRCWVSLVMVDVALRTHGFPRLRARIHRRWPRKPNTMTQADVAETSRRVNRACRAYFKRAWCLQRSAALTWLLRGRGVPCDLVLGVRSIPFAAHAWSELDGHVINDAATVRDDYQEIDRCGALPTGMAS